MRGPPRGLRDVLRPLALLLLIGLVAGDATAQLGYYLHSLAGGAKLLLKRRPIERVLRDPELDPAVRSKLETALEIRAFASRELGLPDNKSYRSYVELEREFVSWTVTAAPELAVEPLTWCFPVAGCVSYKGFFTPDKAAGFAEELREEGHDVAWGGVAAYSTLGWFADPVLSTFLARPDVELAGLVFHELAHQVVYVTDSTPFNESFATAVELEGVRRWLATRPNGAGGEASYRLSKRREGALTDLLLAYRARLAEVYASAATDGAKRSAKREIFADLDADLVTLGEAWGDPQALAGWIGQELNNAHLGTVGAYHQWVPAFETLLAESGDLPRFYEEVERLADLAPDERDAQLAALARTEANDEPAKNW